MGSLVSARSLKKCLFSLFVGGGGVVVNSFCDNKSSFTVRLSSTGRAWLEV